MRTYSYELNTKQFRDEIFKFCSCCKIFQEDFAIIFCEMCGSKLNYITIDDDIDDDDIDSVG